MSAAAATAASREHSLSILAVCKDCAPRAIRRILGVCFRAESSSVNPQTLRNAVQCKVSLSRTEDCNSKMCPRTPLYEEEEAALDLHEQRVTKLLKLV